MPSPLEKQLATALASAVNAECGWFLIHKDVDELPAWYSEAVEALAEFENEREQQVLDKSREY